MYTKIKNNVALWEPNSGKSRAEKKSYLWMLKVGAGFFYIAGFIDREKNQSDLFQIFCKATSKAHDVALHKISKVGNERSA